ncbi:class I SAM-dependent methyltransferase [Runella salmonicolor]|uniref:DUF268 domain-containing protein n=1 Tax=Runella salmonicolor TaxID=2950278 RepID=A0ABT1FHH0_9BACT|nr:class I SAM-dependent methyltransferase [Runella salmonicolor]MCP1381210.1 DUF268 domain-containing protein [Runella salmonicolor]
MKIYRTLKRNFFNKIMPILEGFKLRRRFESDFELYNTLATVEAKAKKEYLYPCLYDATSETYIEPMYFYQDAWAFERILLNNPNEHIDIGSSHKLVSFLSKITSLTMVDIRPLSLEMDTIKFMKGDILDLPFKEESVESLSSICVIEHIGLGRYGDKIDPLGTERAVKEINRVLKKGANFYFSVPVEEINKVYFNAHRAFNEEYLLSFLFPNFEVVDKKYIYGTNFQNTINAQQFGVGCYHLKKRY